MQFAILTIAACCLSAAPGAKVEEARIDVHAGQVISHVTPYMSGIVLEDCNHEIYGGLYSQMVFGESFQEPATSLLKGFQAHGGIWTPKDGELWAESRVPAKLIADVPPFADGEIGVEIRGSENQRAVGGLLLRVNNAGLGVQNLEGYEVLIHGFAATVRLSRYNHLKQWHRDGRPMPKQDHWIALVVKLQGNRIEVLADGQTMHTYEDPGSPLAAGGIGLSVHSTQARFRNLWVKTGGRTTRLDFAPNTSSPPDAVSHEWQALRRGTVDGLISLETRQPLFGKQSQRLTFSGGQGEIGIENRGLNRWGMHFQQGKPYEGCLRAKAEKPTEVCVALESGDGARVYAETQLHVADTDWQKLDFTLTPQGTDPKGRLAIKLKQPGSVVVGYAFLQPGPWGRFKGLPVRGDIAQALANETFKVARYGGSMVHGGYRWKPMIGPRDRRPPYGSGYYSYPTHGWGILDFLDLCEAAGLLAIPDFDTGETPLDMADFVEYVNGPADSPWGGKRAADGHPQPYRLKHLEIGNEGAINEQYWQHFQPVALAIWAKDPGMVLVVGDYEYPNVITDPFHIKAPHITTLEAHRKILELAKQYGAEVWFDVHLGTGDAFLRGGLRGFPSFIEALGKIAAGAKYKVCVFELNSYNHDHARGLSNARCISLLERLGDKVPAVTSATGLQPYGHNDNDWDEGLIFFTPTQAWGQPAYYVAQMITRYYQPLCVKAEVQCPGDAMEGNAKRSEDGTTLVLQVVNSGEKPLATRIALNDFSPKKDVARITELCGKLNDVNTPEEPERVKPVEKQWEHRFQGGGIQYTFPPRSFTMMRLE